MTWQAMDDIGWDGGGSGDVYRIFYRMVYTLLFFIVVSTILMNIIFGVIIDTFAELRARKVCLAPGPHIHATYPPWTCPVSRPVVAFNFIF